jgi:hypothetical protein
MADAEELQENSAEGTGEEEALEGSELVNMELPEQGPSLADRVAMRAAALGEGAGRAAGGLLGGIGAKIESPGPPTDDLRDLFEGPDMDRDNDVYIEDLVTVSEEDVFGDGGEDMSDLLEVTDEDIFGDVDEVLSLGEGHPAAGRPLLRRPPRPAPSPYGMIGIQ